jgi:hypothetical protein
MTLANLVLKNSPDGLPATVIVEDVLVGLVEGGDHVEDPLGQLGDEGAHHASCACVNFDKLAYSKLFKNL